MLNSESTDDKAGCQYPQSIKCRNEKKMIKTKMFLIKEINVESVETGQSGAGVDGSN